jgi:hypothetical protein
MFIVSEGFCGYRISPLKLNPIAVFFFAPRGSVGSPVSHRKGKGENKTGRSSLTVTQPNCPIQDGEVASCFPLLSNT